MGSETHEFQAEVKQLLDLMIHSLYSHKDVFLRELISNASDALDRVRFLGLTDQSLLPDEELAITLRVDPEARSLSVEDNGIGMSRSALREDLGTIARSGTAQFLEKLREAGDQSLSADLIGQFGVGFYASFMVSSEISVVTRKAGEAAASLWRSSGDGAFTIEDAERAGSGTTVRLTLAPMDGDEGIAGYCDEFVLRQIVKKYSDFVSYPIRLVTLGKDLSGGDEPLNSMKAIWTRADDDVSEDEHKEFYKHISHDWSDPLLHVATKIEGTFEARALLYVPSVAPFDLYHREMLHRGIQLYVKRVFIMDECRDLIPEWLRFVRGVVDAEDISLNVSREMLQRDRQIQSIRKHLVKKVLEALADLKRDDPDDYLSFWAQFGAVLKEGLLPLGEQKDKERLLGLMLCASTHHESKLSALDEVVARMPEDQEVIYYLTGTARELIENSPHIEAFREKNIEVVLFTDHVDEIWLTQTPPEYEEKRWQSVGKGQVDLGSEEERAQADETHKQEEETFTGLLGCIRSAVQDDVKEVRLSRRLTSSPACLVLEEGDITPQIAEMLRQAGQTPPDVKPILELNPTHPIMAKLQTIFAENGTDPRLHDYAELLYDHALLAEGGRLKDPVAFGMRLADLMLKAL